jgi:hypothetical protein
VHSDEHWSFVTPLRPGEVLDAEPRGAPTNVHYEGRSYRLFQQATARVTHVMGEFYWKVAVGEQADTVDWVRPPFGISKELTRDGASEIAYSHARYVDRRFIERTFGVEGLNRPAGVGSMQPFPGPALGATWAVMLTLLLVVALVVGIMKPRRSVIDQTYDLSAAVRPEGAPENVRVLFTDPFDLGGANNLEVKANASLDNDWLYLALDLVDESNGGMQSFELPLEYYSGVEDGDRWTEGSRDRRIFLPPPPKGRYVMRIEGQWTTGKLPPPVHIRVREGVFRGPHFLLAFLAISAIPAITLLRKISWEAQRWKESAHSPFGALGEMLGEEEE